MPEPEFREEGLLGFAPGPEGGVSLRLDGGMAAVTIARDGSVRLRAAAGALPPDAGEAVGFAPFAPSTAEPFALDDGGVGLSFSGPEGAARVEVDPDPFALRVRDRAGHVLASLSGLGFAPDGRARVALAAPVGQRFHGFGEKTGPFDQRGRVLRMRNRDQHVRPEIDPLYASIPFFLSLSPPTPLGDESVATGVFLDAPAPSRFDLAASDRTRVVMETAAGGIDLTIFPGPRPADVLRRFTARVGRTPVPPLWALGHHQSRWSYGSEAEVRALAREIRRRGIPTDVIHLDIDYMDGFRVFRFDPRRFPQPGRLLRELAAQGFRVVTIIDPGVKVDPEWDVFREGVARGFFCRERGGALPALRVWPGDAALPDFNRAEVRAWWGGLHRPLVEAGVAGIWNDMNEPAGWTKDVRLGRFLLPFRPQDLSRTEQAPAIGGDARVPHEHVRNLYGQQHSRATREGLEALRPEQRPFVLSRSGYAGIQRHAALWTGDTWSTFAQLRLSVRMLLQLSVSGVAFCGADIGGFAGICSPELFARWMQIGALYPFARTHAMWLKGRQEPWSFGPRIEAIARAALGLRMRLMPYLYGLFHEAAASGEPVWRPLFYAFPDDPDAARIDDQLMLGPSLLVAPVLDRGARRREVYLPEGTWIALDDGARYAGPRRIEVSAPLERLPIFARGGAVVPMRSAVQHAGEAPAEPLVLAVFPGGDSAGVLIEDDGETTAHLRGAMARTPLRVRDRAGGRLRLELGAREGGFAIAPRPARVVFHAAGRPRAVLLDALPLEEAAGAPGYERRDGRVEVRFEDDGGARSIELEPAP